MNKRLDFWTRILIRGSTYIGGPSDVDFPYRKGRLKQGTHHLLTRYSLEDQEWLDALEPVPHKPEPFKERKLYHNRYVVEPPGGSDLMAPRDILAFYSDEPDWDMDKFLWLSPMQMFMGHSQGYRHMYFPAGTFHFPFHFLPMGDAPNRAQLYYDLSQRAFEKGSLFWRYRYLARCFHFIQDVTQPFHTCQICRSMVNWRSPLFGTIFNLMNLHFAFEDLVIFRLYEEKEKKLPPLLLDAMRRSRPLPKPNNHHKWLKKLTDIVARRSHALAASLIHDLSLFFKDRFPENSADRLNLEELDRLAYDEKTLELYRYAEIGLADAAAAVKCVIGVICSEQASLQ